MCLCRLHSASTITKCKIGSLHGALLTNGSAVCLLVLRRVTTMWGAILAFLSLDTYFAFGPWGLHYESKGATWLLGSLLVGFNVMLHTPLAAPIVTHKFHVVYTQYKMRRSL